MAPIAEVGTDPASSEALAEHPWAEFGRRLRAFVARRGVAASDVEDLVQEVLLKGFLQRESVQRGRLTAWLYTTARRALVDRRRSAERRARRVRDDAEVEDLAATERAEPSALQELARCLEPLLAELDPRDREILQRVEIEGEAQVELARELALPLSTLKSRVQRARRRLRERYESCCGLELDGRGVPLDCAPRAQDCGPGCG